jgi:hypothetical protein
MKKLIYILFLLLHINITYSQTIGNNPNTSSVSSNILGNNNTWTGVNTFTGLISKTTALGTNSIDLNSFTTGTIKAIDFKYPSGGIFRAAEYPFLGTTDIFFQGVPNGSSNYTILESYNSAGLQLGTGGNSSPIGFNINRTEKMRLSTNGNLLLNTITDAGYKLDVNGTGRFGSNVISSGFTSLSAPFRSVDNIGSLWGADAGGAGGIGFSTGLTKVSIALINGTADNRISGQTNMVSIVPIYNQTSGTASNTDLLINRTETSVGSGIQRLLDLQVGGASKFSVTNNGRTYINENLTVANVTTAGQLRLATIGTIFNTAPTSATDTGVLGEIRVTSGFIYVCTNTNTWVRSALTTW